MSGGETIQRVFPLVKAREGKLRKVVNKFVSGEMVKTKAEKEIKKTELGRKVRGALDEGAKKILLYGVTGTGKTYILTKICHNLKKMGEIDDFLRFPMVSGMEDIDLLGKFFPQEGGKIKFVPSVLLPYIEMAQEKKVAIILDEFNRASSKALNILIPLLEEVDGMVSINNYIKGEIIKAPAENLLFFLAANFGASYSGTYQIDEAIFNRIDAAFHVYFQKEVEDEFLRELSPLVRGKVEAFIDFARELMKQQIVRPFTTRDVKMLCRKLKGKTDFSFAVCESLISKIVLTDALGIPDEEVLDEFRVFFSNL